MTEPKTPCPTCGTRRIGNHRGHCKECNRFAARARTALIAALKADHPRIYTRLMSKAERAVYADLRSTVRLPEEER